MIGHVFTLLEEIKVKGALHSIDVKKENNSKEKKIKMFSPQVIYEGDIKRLSNATSH
jgi:hypothetical protein